MQKPLAVIEYLARSDHRVEVLDAIRTEPRSRGEIRALTDASRVTAGRILADLEDRDWIVRNGTEYEPTPTGRYVAAEFTRLMENLDAFGSLPSVVEWFPDDEPTFDLRRLDDATVVTADEGDLIAPIRRALHLIERSDDLRVVANGASPEFLEAMREAVEAGGSQTILVPEETVTAVRSDADLRPELRRMLETGRATLLQHDGDGPLPVLQIGDGTVALCSGDHQAMIETDDGVVFDWARSYFDTLAAEATAVALEAFAEEPVEAD